MDKESLREEIKKLDERIMILTSQIDNGERNITGLIVQQTRRMDRRDMLEAQKAELEAELLRLEEEEAGV